MSLVQKRMVIIFVFMLTLLGGSIYHYSVKTAPPVVMNAKTTSIQAISGNNGEVVIYLSGAVVQPGVLKIANDARIIDAVNQAGGLAPGAEVSKVNLAQKVKDGLHIHIPGSVLASSTAIGGSKDGKININTADQVQLDKLPGIGPSMAQKIINYRMQNGPFQSLEDLKKVPGIGEVKYNKLKNSICL